MRFLAWTGQTNIICINIHTNVSITANIIPSFFLLGKPHSAYTHTYSTTELIAIIMSAVHSSMYPQPRSVGSGAGPNPDPMQPHSIKDWSGLVCTPGEAGLLSKFRLSFFSRRIGFTTYHNSSPLSSWPPSLDSPSWLLPNPGGGGDSVPIGIGPAASRRKLTHPPGGGSISKTSLSLFHPPPGGGGWGSD